MQVECLGNGKENGKGYYFPLSTRVCVYLLVFNLFLFWCVCICVSEDTCVRITYTNSLGPAFRSWIEMENIVMKHSAPES